MAGKNKSSSSKCSSAKESQCRAAGKECNPHTGNCATAKSIRDYVRRRGLQKANNNYSTTLRNLPSDVLRAISDRLDTANRRAFKKVHGRANVTAENTGNRRMRLLSYADSFPELLKTTDVFYVHWKGNVPGLPDDYPRRFMRELARRGATPKDVLEWLDANAKKALDEVTLASDTAKLAGLVPDILQLLQSTEPNKPDSEMYHSSHLLRNFVGTFCDDHPQVFRLLDELSKRTGMAHDVYFNAFVAGVVVREVADGARRRPLDASFDGDMLRRMVTKYIRGYPAAGRPAFVKFMRRQLSSWGDLTDPELLAWFDQTF